MTEPLNVRAALGCYRGLGRLTLPAVRLLLQRRAARGKEDPTRLKERFGRASQARPPGPLVWFHGASIGEALSALPLIARLEQDRPDCQLLVTTGTVTSARLMAARLPARAIHQYVPVDLPFAVEAFLDHWQPDLAFLIESELWPNLVTRAAQRGVELVLINARISEASVRNWRRFPSLAQSMLQHFGLILTQTARDEARFRTLGANRLQTPGNLKFAAPVLPSDEAELESLRTALSGRTCWLAASTHPGEEEIVARSHCLLSAKVPNLLTVIAPRHPERGARIAAVLRDHGLTVARRSRSDTIGLDTEVYLSDTIGDLGLWYRLVPIAFIGGSLVPHGGHNLLEPAKLGAVLLCGPHTGNFADIAREMSERGALQRVEDGEGLCKAVERLLTDPTSRPPLAQAALDYAHDKAQVLDQVWDALGPSLARLSPPAAAPLQRSPG